MTGSAVLCDDVLELNLSSLLVVEFFACGCSSNIKVELNVMLTGGLENTLNADWMLEILVNERVQLLLLKRLALHIILRQRPRHVNMLELLWSWRTFRFGYSFH